MNAYRTVTMQQNGAVVQDEEGAPTFTGSYSDAVQHALLDCANQSNAHKGIPVRLDITVMCFEITMRRV